MGNHASGRIVVGQVFDTEEEADDFDIKYGQQVYGKTVRTFSPFSQYEDDDRIILGILILRIHDELTEITESVDIAIQEAKDFLIKKFDGKLVPKTFTYAKYD